jgi:UDP:flavonoid glycosyltransferase YjiC (YdhE family)
VTVGRLLVDRGGMTKVLMASLAVDGHFNPLTGIAKQLLGSGDDVGWYTGSRYAAKLTELGIPHFPFRRAVEHTPENLNDLYPERTRLKGPQAISFDAEKIFASNVGDFFSDLCEIKSEFGFDVLVTDAAVFVQRLVTEVLGLPVVSVIPVANMQADPQVPPIFFGFQPATGWLGKVRDWAFRVLSDKVVLAPAQRRYASILADHGVDLHKSQRLLEEPYVTSAAVIQSGTMSFDFPRSQMNPRVHYVGPLIPYRLGEPAPFTFQGKLRHYRRTVLVTQGTVDNKDASKLIIPTIEGLQDTDTLLVVSTGRRGTAELRRRYPASNVLIEDYIDFEAALPYTDVFVTNGGFGGVMLSLVHGVPLVCAGINEGKNDVNAHVEYHRVGMNLRVERPRPKQIRQAVDRVAAESQWSARARAFQAELSQMNPPVTAESIIRDVVRSHAVHG